MNKRLLTIVLSGMLVSPASAAGGPFGLGVIVGEPTGITAKMYLDSEKRYAADAGAAWSLSGDNELHLYGDYLFHEYSLLHNALRVSKGKLPLYFGVGGRVKFRENKDDKVGIRIPVGSAYQFDGFPLEAFAEVVPILDLAPDTKLAWNGGVGIRFHF